MNIGMIEFKLFRAIFTIIIQNSKDFIETVKYLGVGEKKLFLYAETYNN